MKKYLLLVASVLLLASCSTPKYTYYFDHYDYNSGKKTADVVTVEQLALINLAKPETGPLKLDQQAVAASASKRITPIENKALNVPSVTKEDLALLEKKYSSLSKDEKKAFRKELKSEVKRIVKATKSGEDIASIAATKAMDHDLKMALVFGIVGIVLSAFGGVNAIFWILGTVAVVVALVFLIVWLSKQ